MTHVCVHVHVHVCKVCQQGLRINVKSCNCTPRRILPTTNISLPSRHCIQWSLCHRHELTTPHPSLCTSQFIASDALPYGIQLPFEISSFTVDLRSAAAIVSKKRHKAYNAEWHVACNPPIHHHTADDDTRCVRGGGGGGRGHSSRRQYVGDNWWHNGGCHATLGHQSQSQLRLALLCPLSYMLCRRERVIKWESKHNNNNNNCAISLRFVTARANGN